MALWTSSAVEQIPKKFMTWILCPSAVREEIGSRGDTEQPGNFFGQMPFGKLLQDLQTAGTLTVVAGSQVPAPAGTGNGRQLPCLEETASPIPTISPSGRVATVLPAKSVN
ncbi:MAG: hypothetical protein ACK57G_14235 [Planctomycetota bacterium]